ncbi:MAG: DNA gyrase inhibitor YacG [Candidatus Berkiellales bacterium]
MNKEKQKAFVLCPTCQKKCEFSPNNPHRPFCSERCKLIDLGNWASEEYKVPTDEKIKDDDENDENKI